VAHVANPELNLVSIFSHIEWNCHDSRIVDEEVQSIRASLELICGTLYRCKGIQVQLQVRNIAIWDGLLDVFDRGLSFRWCSSSEEDLFRIVFGELGDRLFAKANVSFELSV
jgi:hypothetical protein